MSWCTADDAKNAVITVLLAEASDLEGSDGVAIERYESVETPGMPRDVHSLTARST